MKKPLAKTNFDNFGFTRKTEINRVQNLVVFSDGRNWAMRCVETRWHTRLAICSDACRNHALPSLHVSSGTSISVCLFVCLSACLKKVFLTPLKHEASVLDKTLEHWPFLSNWRRASGQKSPIKKEAACCNSGRDNYFKHCPMLSPLTGSAVLSSVFALCFCDCLSVCLSVCRSVCLSVCLSVCIETGNLKQHC